MFAPKTISLAEAFRKSAVAPRADSMMRSVSMLLGYRQWVFALSMEQVIAYCFHYYAQLRWVPPGPSKYATGFPFMATIQRRELLPDLRNGKHRFARFHLTTRKSASSSSQAARLSCAGKRRDKETKASTAGAALRAYILNYECLARRLSAPWETGRGRLRPVLRPWCYLHP